MEKSLLGNMINVLLLQECLKKSHKILLELSHQYGSIP